MNALQIIPAIDLLDGCAVRLREGLRNESTVYSSEPAELIDRWADAGATRVHVVDLDGAFAGDRAQRRLTEQIIARSRVEVQVGGGLRSAAAIRACLESGAAAAVVGTAAIKAPAEVAAMCAEFPGQIIVAVDARAGIVTTEGWTEESQLTAAALSERAAEWGAAAVLYTDVARDGTEVGPNLEATAALAKALGTRVKVIASGGVGSIEHICALTKTKAASVVVGRALYENRFSLAEAIAAGGAGAADEQADESC